MWVMTSKDSQRSSTFEAILRIRYEYSFYCRWKSFHKAPTAHACAQMLCVTINPATDKCGPDLV